MAGRTHALLGPEFDGSHFYAEQNMKNMVKNLKIMPKIMKIFIHRKPQTT